jgi:tRNA threonylcarbamoyladenosine biosynthesis protein TsaB
MILLIDTAQEKATVALAKAGEVLFSEENRIAKEHATWLHTAIGRLIEKAEITLKDLVAVAVVAGPGSYTGLRVGMAAAKGFCYALKIPLITQNTLRVMAESMHIPASETQALVCPTIDARRDEVFTALYQADMVEILPSQALILDKTAFENTLSEKPIIFFGSGAAKWKEICSSPNALFKTQEDTIQAFASLVQRDFATEKWADLIYSEPVYLKEFFTY